MAIQWPSSDALNEKWEWEATSQKKFAWKHARREESMRAWTLSLKRHKIQEGGLGGGELGAAKIFGLAYG